MGEARVEEAKAPLKVLGMNVTVDLIIKVAGFLVAATLLYANMNSNASMLGVKIDSKYELIETKLENFEWRMKQVESKLDQAERRAFEEARRRTQQP